VTEERSIERVARQLAPTAAEYLEQMKQLEERREARCLELLSWLNDRLVLW
jgi:hypothetical protein